MSGNKTGRPFLPVLLLLLVICVAAPVLMGAKCDGDTCDNEHSGDGGTPVQSEYVFSNQGDFGILLYNKNIDVGSVTSKKEETDGEITLVSTTYVTSDGYDDVATWFGSELGTPASVDETVEGEPYGAVWEKAGDDGHLVKVRIYDPENGAGTAIEVARVKM